MYATSPIFPFCFQGYKYNVHPIFGAYDTWINIFSEHILFSLGRGGGGGEGQAEKFHIRVMPTLENF